MQDHPRAVVTGATGGIGEAIATRLAAQGMQVVLVGRDENRLADAARRIGLKVPTAKPQTELADLSLLADTRDLAVRLTAAPPPTVVVANAAVLNDPEQCTAEGLPVMLATNHLSPYLLLRLLIVHTATWPTRFVIVGADPGALARVPVNVDNLTEVPSQGLGRIPSLRAFAFYARTKNMNTMTVYSLARRLAGTRITVNGAHPGIISGTGLGRHTHGLPRVIDRAFNHIRPGPDAGADTPVWLATSTDVENANGQFFVRRTAVSTAAHTTDPTRCDQLWNESARLTGLPAAATRP